jgi:hypothetical protein
MPGSGLKRACLDCGIPTIGSRCGPCERTYKAPYHTPEYRRERAPLIGRACELRLPGCTGVADTADHVIPKAVGHGRGPLRPACAHCNFARGAG